MEYTVKRLKGLARQVNVTIPAQTFSEQIENRLQEWSKEWPKRSKVPGFRPGKAVPMSVVRRRFGDDIHQESMRELANQSLSEVMQKEKFELVAMPDLNWLSETQGEPLKFTAEFEVFPDFKLADLSKLKLKKPVAEISEADIDDAIEKVRVQNADWAAVERKSKDKDRVTIDFLGTLKGVPFEGGEGKDLQIILGEGRVIPDFEKGLKGRKSGDKAKFSVKFPKDYGSTELAGQKAEFAITVHKVEEATLPALDDAFATKMQATDGTMESLRKDVRGPMEQELERQLLAAVRSRLEDELRKAHKMDCPIVLLKQEIHRIGEANRLDHAKIHAIEPGSKDPIAVDADKNIKIGLIFRRLIKELEIKVTEDDIKAYIRKLAMGYADEDAFVNWYLEERQRLEQAQSAVLEEKLFETALDKMKVVEEKMSFEALKALANQGG